MRIRQRHIKEILEKRARLYPTLGVLGPRQVGKSTFLMKEWRELTSAQYITFDKYETIVRAKAAPEQFLLLESENQTRHLIIDEAQKIPYIFDSIKSIIDEKRRMGSFTLSGSTEFSSKSGVRESLAGRMGLSRMYPMTCREIQGDHLHAPWLTDFKHLPDNQLSIKTVTTWLERGGMPIFCGISDTSERIEVINSWLEAICYRDLLQLKGEQYQSDLAMELLRSLALHPNVSYALLARQFGVKTSVLKNHLSALEALFLIYEIPNYEKPNSSSQYRIFDSGVLNALMGGHDSIHLRSQSLITLLVNEILAQYEYSGNTKPTLSYYRSRGGAQVDLILKTSEKTIAINCMNKVEIRAYDLRSLKSFLKIEPNSIAYIIAPVQESYQIDERIFVLPWISIG